MLLRAFRAKNYKSLRETPKLTFGSGINVIVGQNNAGKTALLEALSGPRHGSPHRSQTIDRPSDTSSFEYVIEFERDELLTLIRGDQISDPWLIYAGSDQEDRTIRQNRISAFLQRADQRIEGINITGPNGALHVSRTSYDREIILERGKPLIVSQVSSRNRDNPVYFNDTSVDVTHGHILENQLVSYALRHVYMFRAERLNIHRHQVGGAGELNPDASNLPQVLDNFQFNSARYQRYIECFRRIFPHVYDIRVLFTRDNEKEIRAWMAPPATERTDLAFPLSDCGTGIGQVLAMLYVVINSSNPRTLIIDEPNSFLHPGAVRELIRILQENPRHQYIISTHSPAVVDVAKPSNLHILSWVDGQTKVTSTDAALVEAQRLVLKEVGASFADVFGAERVLWVEGKTEEVCFPRILAHFELLEARTAVVGVVNTGDFDGRGADRAILIYQRLSSGALMPESVSFLFDKEERSHQHQNDLRKLGKGRINFTNMRMFESYLISIPEIYLVFGRSLLEAGIDDAQITLAMVEVKLNEILGEASIANVNAPKVLERLFYDLSGGRLRYEKVKHGLALTEAILANNPDRLRPLATQIAAALHPNPL